MTGAATKADAMMLMERGWQDLDSRFAALSERELQREVFTGEGSGWRLRDLMPHFARWRERPVAEQLAELRAARDDLRAALAQLPAPLLITDGADTDGIRGYVWQPAVNHLRQHAEHIDAALAEKGAST